MSLGSPEPSNQTQITAPAQRLKQKRGLLLDGHPTSSFRFGVALQNAGALVTVAADTPQATDLIQCGQAVSEGFDFLVVHFNAIQNQDQPGLDAVRSIRTLGYTGAVVALIEDDCPEEHARLEEACKQAGCQVVAADNQQPDQWIDALNAVLSQKAASGATEGDTLEDEGLGDSPSALAGLMATQVAPENRLLQRFVEKLPARLDSVQAAMRQSDLLLLETLLQQFKRSADAHGYAPLGHSIRDVESRIRENEKDLEDIQHAVESLMDLCEDAAFARGPDDEPPSVA